jgi:DNA-binding ferritin-like protein
MTVPIPPKTIKKEGYFLAYLIGCSAQIHVYHLRAKGSGSFAAHMALGDLYSSIPDMVDALAESMQGKMGLLNYEYTLKLSNNYPEALSHIKETIAYIERERKGITQDTYVQNQIDEIVSKFWSTVYKLENLQ